MKNLRRIYACVQCYEREAMTTEDEDTKKIKSLRFCRYCFYINCHTAIQKKNFKVTTCRFNSPLLDMVQKNAT